MENTKKKYIYISIGIAVAILVILVFSCIFFVFQNKNVTYSTITASDGSFEINFPSNIRYQINQSQNNDFAIDLYSNQDEMFFYATKISKSREIDLYQIVVDDKENYLKEKQNIQDDSGIIPFTIGNYKSYEYKFVHSDSSYGKDFYSNVVWIETDTNLYVLNFEVVTDNMEKYQDIFLNIKNSFVEL
ncbi:MAG: hypothetical protein J6A04_05615 [Clostridia bacterium]|nr:hypothetical protein [Clostridia bacterium]